MSRRGIMLHIYICDDEKAQRKNLHTIVSTQMELRGIEYRIVECNSGENLVTLIGEEQVNCDIIFLDIEMDRLNGIQTAKKIREFNNTAVIVFITGFADYVFDGYDVKALNYVLKPYKKEKIVEIIDQALKAIDYEANKYYNIQSGKNIYKISFNDIMYISSNRRKIIVKTISNQYEFYGKLDEVELDFDEMFIRIHQRYLVNSRFIESIENYSINVHGEILTISKRKYQDVMVAYAKSMLG